MADKRGALPDVSRQGPEVEPGKIQDMPPGIFKHLMWTIHRLAAGTDLAAIRFRSRASMSFPCMEVESVDAASEDGKTRLDVRTNIGGLDGLAGPLPVWLNDILAREDPDHAPLGDFLNIFSHRFIESLYLAWIKYRPDLSYRDDGRDPVSLMLFSLLGAKSMIERPSGPPAFQPTRALPHVGSIGGRNCSASGLEGMLRHFFAPVEIKIREFVPRKVAIPFRKRAFLDGNSVRLGKNAVIGEQVKDVAGAFRIVVFPPNLSVFTEFLPRGGNFRRLKGLVAVYLSGLLAWDLAIRVKGDLIPRLRLSAGEKESRPQLGYNTWLISRPKDKEAESIFRAAA
jgi:type VI secretion system protein ImpH